MKYTAVKKIHILHIEKVTASFQTGNVDMLLFMPYDANTYAIHRTFSVFVSSVFQQIACL